MSDKKSFFDKVISGIKSVAPTVAGTVANGFVPGSGSMVENLMRSVTGDNDSDIETVAGKICSDPNLFLQVQSRAMEHEEKMADIEAKKLESVNQTMREESKSEHWPQYSWRPFNGFSFPPVIFCIYFILPLLGKTVPDVPYWIWAGWLSILGVATWGRNQLKRTKAGEQSPGIIANTINAIRGGN